MFNKNIKLLRKRKGLTQDAVAKALNMKRSTLSGYENEVSQPTVPALAAFAKYFNVAMDTLINVDLSQLSNKQLRQLEDGYDVYIKGSKLRVLATTVGSDNEENIELVPEKAKAGYATGFADPEFIKELPSFRLPFLSRQKKYRTFQLSGDSMLPIPDKAWVTGEYIQDWNSMVSGHAYIIFTLNDGIVFKVVENLIKKEHKLTLYSLNPLYKPFDVPIGEVREVWKFVNFISHELPDPLPSQENLMKTISSLKQDMERVKLRLSGNDGNVEKS
ncbi:MAG: XRE family transcriptional regulator [Bacteroidota bacterium]